MTRTSLRGARRSLVVFGPSQRVLVFLCCLGSRYPSASMSGMPWTIFMKTAWRALSCGQLSASSFDEHTQLQGLRTIINLRGPNPAERWYREELAVSQRDGLIHIDLPIDSLFPTKEEIVELMKALKTAPRPILVHCQSGIDRTGIASALACLLLDDSSSAEKALEQLSWQYGSMPWRKSRESKRDFLLAYAAWLHGHQLTHSRKNFQNWLHEVVQIDGPGGNGMSKTPFEPLCGVTITPADSVSKSGDFRTHFCFHSLNRIGGGGYRHRCRPIRAQVCIEKLNP